MLRAIPPRVGAAAAAAVGLVWVVKAGAVLLADRDVVGGVDLGSLFVAVQVFLALTVLGLHRLAAQTGVLRPGAPAPPDVVERVQAERELAREQDEPLGFEDPAVRIRRRAAVGFWAGVTALVLGTVVVIDALLGPSVIGGLASLATSLAWIAGLAGTGLATAELRVLTARSASLPFRMALWSVPAFLAGGLLSTVDERLLELPVLVYGGLFVVLAWQLWRADPLTTPTGGRPMPQPGGR